MLLPEFLSFGRIDDYDFLSDLGIAVTTGADTFKAPHQPKEVYSYKWPDQNGTQYDLDSPVYKEARVFRIEGWLIANSEAEFNAKFEALDALLFNNGYRTIYVKAYDITVTCRLKSFPKWERPKGVKILGSDFIGIEIAIEFDEVMSVDSGFYLVEMDGTTFLMTTENEFITLNKL